ncbi:hypothetical protein ZWY2020_043283 [Hordeum vulgare]|nr:hypothetical protein ZWY2020_043283 [Hordeum vulgare]
MSRVSPPLPPSSPSRTTRCSSPAPVQSYPFPFEDSSESMGGRATVLNFIYGERTLRLMFALRLMMDLPQPTPSSAVWILLFSMPFSLPAQPPIAGSIVHPISFFSASSSDVPSGPEGGSRRGRPAPQCLGALQGPLRFMQKSKAEVVEQR